jgi:hypothetical protein
MGTPEKADHVVDEGQISSRGMAPYAYRIWRMSTSKFPYAGEVLRSGRWVGGSTGGSKDTVRRKLEKMVDTWDPVPRIW